MWCGGMALRGPMLCLARGCPWRPRCRPPPPDFRDARGALCAGKTAPEPARPTARARMVLKHDAPDSAAQETDEQYCELDSRQQRDDGTTAVTAVLVGKRLVVAHCGDSRRAGAAGTSGPAHSLCRAPVLHVLHLVHARVGQRRPAASLTTSCQLHCPPTLPRAVHSPAPAAWLQSGAVLRPVDAAAVCRPQAGTGRRARQD